MRGSPIKTVYARRMRKSPTTGEALLWEQLRRKQLGVKFRRQVPLYGYIADFYCPSRYLVVEVDGGYHAGRTEHDSRRDDHLAQRGIGVLRIHDDLVRADLARAVQLVRAALRDPGYPQRKP
jgi:very-short-patch-repair endonuclease